MSKQVDYWKQIILPGEEGGGFALDIQEQPVPESRG